MARQKSNLSSCSSYFIPNITDNSWSDVYDLGGYGIHEMINIYGAIHVSGQTFLLPYNEPGCSIGLCYSGGKIRAIGNSNAFAGASCGIIFEFTK